MRAAPRGDSPVGASYRHRRSRWCLIAARHKVTIVEKAVRLLAAEQPWVGQMAADTLRAAAVTVLTGVEARSAREHTLVVDLSDGSR